MPKVRLEKCIPFEPSVGETTYQKYRQGIAAGKTLPPVSGVPVDDDCYLITNGNHRCKAAVDEGWAEIELVIDTRSSSIVRNPQFVVDMRRDQGLQGFTALRVVSDAEYGASGREDRCTSLHPRVTLHPAGQKTGRGHWQLRDRR